MLPKTRQKFNAFTQQLFSHVGQGGHQNGVIYYTPNAQQISYLATSEQAQFLKEINHLPVDAQLGERIGIGVTRPIASRTKTEDNDRKTSEFSDLAKDQYFCAQTNFDSHINYKTMDSWAHLDKFGDKYGKSLNGQKARDRLMIGFNGTSAAEDTDRENNPLLEDVNVGWLDKVRRVEPQRIMGFDSEGVATADEFNVGEGGDFGTLDALVFDLVTNLLDAWHQGGDDLICLVGRDIWTNHGLTLLSNSAMPTERVALQSWFAAQTVAGLPCVMPPFFPARSVVVTSYSNLSIYYQLSSMRRTIIDNPKRDRVEEYHSQNEAYVVEDFGKFAGVRNGAILLKDSAGNWA